MESRRSHLTILGPASRDGYASPMPRVVVRCECGRVSQKIANHVRTLRSVCCGHDLCPFRKGRRRDKTGQRFGQMLVLRADEQHQIRSRLKWWVRCDCGENRLVSAKHLVAGGQQGCGGPAHKHKTHGMSKTKLYHVWQAMWARCRNKNNKEYHNYGARGIDVCEEWKDFARFASDMGPRPTGQHSLDRKNNAKGYTAKNCWWALAGQQQSNKRKNVWLSWRGKKQIQARWEEELQLCTGTLSQRRKDGKSGDALFAAPKTRRKKWPKREPA